MRQRVTLCKEGRPERSGGLVIKRAAGADPAYAYAISNAPASTPLGTLVWLSGGRWAIEQYFAESKTALGMDHYEIRNYAGWHHHRLTTMLAHFFLRHLKLKLGKKAPALTVSQFRTLWEVVLPLRTYNIPDVLVLVAWMQQRHHSAYRSHRKRRETEG